MTTHDRAALRKLLDELAAITAERDRMQAEVKRCSEDMDRLRKEVGQARELQRQWQETHTACMDESCDGIEKHCTCVGTLRESVRRLQAELDEARTRIAELERRLEHERQGRIARHAKLRRVRKAAKAFMAEQRYRIHEAMMDAAEQLQRAAKEAAEKSTLDLGPQRSPATVERIEAQAKQARQMQRDTDEAREGR